MLNVFNVIGLVRSDPIYLEPRDKKFKNDGFVKFTIRNDSDVPWVMKKDLPPERRGDVYFDCLASCEKGMRTGKYALKNVHRGDTVAITGRIVAGKKPIRDETEGYRSNWVYGDYIYISVQRIELIRTEKERFKNASPYNENTKSLSRADQQKNYKRNRIISASEEVSDEDITFNL